MSRERIIDQVRRGFLAEVEALRKVGERIGGEVADAVELILNCRGRVVLTGIGKAGLIARKIAATFSSTGTPAIFLHPAEAIHGDLGIVSSDDVAMIFSKSGFTQEITALIPYLKRIGIKIIAVTGNLSSPLAMKSDIVLNIRVDREADPLGFVPTSSTTAMLAMGDAIASALIAERGFKAEDFARFHPGGSLGKKLLLRVCDVMHVGDENPIIGEDKTVREAVLEMTSKGLGAVSVVNESGKLVGIITDGDLRRLLQRTSDPLNLRIGEVMTRTPKWITGDVLGVDAIKKMEEHAITVLPVLDDEGRPYGMVHLHDLVKAGLM